MPKDKPPILFKYARRKATQDSKALTPKGIGEADAGC